MIPAFRTIQFYEKSWIERECSYMYVLNGLLLDYRLVPETLSVEETEIQGPAKLLYRIAEPPNIVYRRRTPNERLP